MSGRLVLIMLAEIIGGRCRASPFKIAYMEGYVCTCVHARICVHSHSHLNVGVALCARMRVCEYEGEGVRVWVCKDVQG